MDYDAEWITGLLLRIGGYEETCCEDMITVRPAGRHRGMVWLSSTSRLSYYMV